MPHRFEINQITENREGRRGLHSKTSQAITDLIRGKFREDLMQAIQNGRRDCVPEPGAHTSVC